MLAPDLLAVGISLGLSPGLQSLTPKDVRLSIIITLLTADAINLAIQPAVSSVVADETTDLTPQVSELLESFSDVVLAAFYQITISTHKLHTLVELPHLFIEDLPKKESLSTTLD